MRSLIEWGVLLDSDSNALLKEAPVNNMFMYYYSEFCKPFNFIHLIILRILFSQGQGSTKLMCLCLNGVDYWYFLYSKYNIFYWLTTQNVWHICSYTYVVSNTMLFVFELQWNIWCNIFKTLIVVQLQANCNWALLQW